MGAGKTSFGKKLARQLKWNFLDADAEIEKQEVKFLYENRGEYWFCSPDNPSDRFNLTEDVISGDARFLKENSVVTALVFGEEIMSVTVPVKVELKVKEASEAVKGNTSSNATKEVTLETGALIQVPQFINQDDIISVNTELGQYSERIEKA